MVNHHILEMTQLNSLHVWLVKSYVSSWVLSGMYSPSTEREQQSAKFEPEVNDIGKYNPPLEIIQDVIQSIVLHRLFIWGTWNWEREWVVSYWSEYGIQLKLMNLVLLFIIPR